MKAPAGKTKRRSRLSRMIERLSEGKPVLGLLSHNRKTANARALAASGMDYVVIDMEHAAADWGFLVGFIKAMRGRDGAFKTTPLVRLPVNARELRHNQWQVKQALDAGAFGLMIAQITTVVDAAAAVAAMRYPPFKDDAQPQPRGERGFGPLYALSNWDMEPAEYTRRADLWPLDPDGELFLLVQIESRRAIDNLEKILKVPGVGGAFIGPSDLHADMGYAGWTGVPEVEAEIQRAADIANRMGKPIGIFDHAANTKKRISQGFTILMPGLDIGLTLRGYANLAKAAKAPHRSG